MDTYLDSPLNVAVGALNKMAKTEEISKLIIFLSSDHNSYITGQNFIIDGGFTSK